VFGGNDADKPVTGDVVFLAVPYPAVADVLAQRGDQLAGKVVVGITRHPLNFEMFDSLVVPADASVAAEIASSLSQSRVLDPGAGCAPSPPVHWPARASWTLLASGRSPSTSPSPAPSPRSWHGSAGSPSSADGIPGWRRAPDEGPSRWWYLGMGVLVLTLLALLTLLHRV
jgi:hypothetical protein